MVDGTVVTVKHMSVLYQMAEENSIPEPAIIIRYYEGGRTFGIIQGDCEIQLNAETLPLLIKELRGWNKIAQEAA